MFPEFPRRFMIESKTAKEIKNPNVYTDSDSNSRRRNPGAMSTTTRPSRLKLISFVSLSPQSISVTRILCVGVLNFLISLLVRNWQKAPLRTLPRLQHHRRRARPHYQRRAHMRPMRRVTRAHHICLIRLPSRHTSLLLLLPPPPPPSVALLSRRRDCRFHAPTPCFAGAAACCCLITSYRHRRSSSTRQRAWPRATMQTL